MRGGPPSKLFPQQQPKLPLTLNLEMNFSWNKSVTLAQERSPAGSLQAQSAAAQMCACRSRAVFEITLWGGYLLHPRASANPLCIPETDMHTPPSQVNLPTWSLNSRKLGRNSHPHGPPRSDIIGEIESLQV